MENTKTWKQYCLPQIWPTRMERTISPPFLPRCHQWIALGRQGPTSQGSEVTTSSWMVEDKKQYFRLKPSVQLTNQTCLHGVYISSWPTLHCQFRGEMKVDRGMVFSTHTLWMWMAESKLARCKGVTTIICEIVTISTDSVTKNYVKSNQGAIFATIPLSCVRHNSTTGWQNHSAILQWKQTNHTKPGGSKIISK